MSLGICYYGNIMSEVSPGEEGSGPEKPPNESVKEASAGFVNRTRERLDHDLGSPTLILIMGTVGGVANYLSQGKWLEAGLVAVGGALFTAGVAWWTGRHQSELDEQSERWPTKLAKAAEEKVSRDGQEPKA